VRGDAASSQHSFRLKDQTFDGQNMLLAQAEAGSIDAMAGAEETGFGRGFHGLVPVEDLPGDGGALIEGGDGGKEIEGAEVLALQHSSAAHDVAVFGVAGGVEAATDLCRFLEDGDLVPGDVSVANEEGGRGERGDSTADQVNRRLRHRAHTFSGLLVVGESSFVQLRGFAERSALGLHGQCGDGCIEQHILLAIEDGRLALSLMNHANHRSKKSGEDYAAKYARPTRRTP
jgi:hypothetical protein